MSGEDAASSVRASPPHPAWAREQCLTNSPGAHTSPRRRSIRKGTRDISPKSPKQQVGKPVPEVGSSQFLESRCPPPGPCCPGCQAALGRRGGRGATLFFSPMQCPPGDRLCWVSPQCVCGDPRGEMAQRCPQTLRLLKSSGDTRAYLTTFHIFILVN